MAKQRFNSAADPRRLRWLLAGLFFGLAIPALLLIRQAFTQLELDAFRQQQIVAEGLVQRIDGTLTAAIRAEDGRAFDDFSFSDAQADELANMSRRSPLAGYPVASPVPGALGHFQVDAAGELTTPLLPSGEIDPSDYGLSDEELQQRSMLASELLAILAENQLVSARMVVLQDGRANRQPAVGDEVVLEETSRDDAPSVATGVEPALEQATLEGILVSESKSEAAAGGGIASSAEADDSGRRERAFAVRSPAAIAVEPVTANNQLPSAQDAEFVDERLGQAAFDRLAVRGAASGPQTPAAANPPPARELDEIAVTGSRVTQEQRDQAEEASEPAESPALDATSEPEALAEENAAAPTQVARAEVSNAPVDSVNTEFQAADALAAVAKVSTFESELEPLTFSRLDTGHFVLFRNAWRDGERLIQGLLIDGDAFVNSAVASPFATAGLAQAVSLTIDTGSERLVQLVPAALAGTGDAGTQDLLYASRLSPPLADIELRFSAGDLPPGAAANLIIWTAVVLFLVLTGGIVAMYRFGAKQIELAHQQQNFVSAVSHELKTPLTSIRMYGEMLKSGWASDEKKQTYYDFIFAEGERLSRLIDNVLTLARLNRGTRAVSLETVTVDEVIDLIRSKVSTQAEQAEFELKIEIDEAIQATPIRIDPDAIAQIFINLVDNALKFAADAEERKVLISGRAQDGSVVFAVRDFGPGIPAPDMKRLFELFYRPDNELTRTTVGTGIGLALVRELMATMNGRVDVRNCEPGAEFRLILPKARSSA